jgi:formamidopyrimidine-DNA glycosylase
MPELPDILAYLHALDSRIVHLPLIGIRLNTPFVLRTVDPGIRETTGRRVLSTERIGKRLVFAREDDLFIVIHLMIAGRLQWREPAAKLAGKLALAAFDFGNGTLLLTEAGSKKRASIVEPLECGLAEFRNSLLSENHTLKRALTDPRLFSGIGNAYSDEILHRAKLSPVKLTSRLTESEIEELYDSTRGVLAEWTERLISESEHDFPRKVTAFREGMAVHGRYARPCPKCGEPIQRISFADNECNYCPACQTGGKLLADRALSRLLKSDWPKSLAELEELRARHSPISNRPRPMV